MEIYYLLGAFVVAMGAISGWATADKTERPMLFVFCPLMAALGFPLTVVLLMMSSVTHGNPTFLGWIGLILGFIFFWGWMVIGASLILSVGAFLATYGLLSLCNRPAR